MAPSESLNKLQCIELRWLATIRHVMDVVETYLRELHDIHFSGAGVPETSGYAALANLLNAIGDSLRPKVRCVLSLQNRGAGLPDGGLFAIDQFPKSHTARSAPVQGIVPARGVIEVKPTANDAVVVASGEQVTRYAMRYRHVLVTNYREFVLVGRDADGRPARLEAYQLAADETAFWAATAHPRKMADEHGERLTEYLKRVMLHAAPLGVPEDLA
jgi:hypothetical protein